MKLEEFKEHFNYAPYDLHEFAYELCSVEDCQELSDAAQSYIDARASLQDLMERYEIELG